MVDALAVTGHNKVHQVALAALLKMKRRSALLALPWALRWT